MGNYESFLKARDINSGVGEIEEEKEAANLDDTNPSEASQANDDTQNLMGPDGDPEQNESGNEGQNSGDNSEQNGDDDGKQNNSSEEENPPDKAVIVASKDDEKAADQSKNKKNEGKNGDGAKAGAKGEAKPAKSK